MAKTPTTWFAPNRNGIAVVVPSLDFQDNLGNLIIDNLGNDLSTNILKYDPQPSTLWSNSIAFTAIEDEMGFIILDEMGNAILDEELVAGIKLATQWFTPNRRGSVAVVDIQMFQDNLGNLVMDNIGDSIVTTPFASTPEPTTSWSEV